MRKNSLFIPLLVMFFCAGMEGREAGEDSVKGLSVRARAWNDPLLTLGNVPASEFVPSARLLSVLPSFSSADFRYDMRREDTPVLMQEGDGLQQGSFNAESFLRLDGRSSVDGGVSYQRGVKRNVLWNETSDFDLLYPYVMADSVGGDLQKELYRFHGGYSRRTGNIVYAFAGSYRALHEYRTVDPRPRNITSDIMLAASGGYLTEGMYVAASVSYRKYHQQQTVEFVDPLGANAVLFHLTGLGSDFARFRTTGTFSNTRYRGRGGEVSLVAASLDGNRFQSGVKYEFLKIDRHLINQNEAPITTLRNRKLSAFGAYKMSGAAVDAGLEARISYELRQGDENVIESTPTGRFTNLLSETMYRNRVVDASLKAVMQISRPYGTWSVMPEAGMYLFLSSYEYPSKKMDFTAGRVALEASFTREKGLWMLDLRGGAGYCMNMDKDFSIPQLRTDGTVYTAYEKMYSAFERDFTSGSFSVRLQRALTVTTAVFAKAGARTLFFSGGDRAVYAALSLGVCF